MFKQIKLETKIIVAFMLPVLLVVISAGITYYTGKKTHAMNQYIGEMAVSFADNFPGISDADLETREYVEKFKAEIANLRSSMDAIFKRQLLTTVVMIQVTLVFLILVGVLITRNLRHDIEMEKQQGEAGDIADNVYADVISTVLREYQGKVRRDPSEVLKKVKNNITSQRR